MIAMVIEILAFGCFGSRFYDMVLLNSGVDVCLHERNKVGDEYDAANDDHEKPGATLSTIGYPAVVFVSGGELDECWTPVANPRLNFMLAARLAI